MKLWRVRNSRESTQGWQKIQENYYACLGFSGWREIFEWPLPKIRPYFMCKLIAICVFCPLANALLAYSTIMESVSLSDRFLSISLWLEQMQSFSKIVYIMTRLERFKSLILNFTDFECAHQEKAFLTMSNVSKKLTLLRKYWFYSSTAVLMSFLIPPVVFSPRGILFGENAENMTKVFPITYPFPTNRYPIPLFIFLFEAVAGASFVVHFAQINFFFVTVAVLLCGMFTVLNETLMSSSATASMYIKDHQRLLWTANEIRQLLSPIVLVQLFISSFNLSLSIVLMVIIPQGESSVIFKNIVYTIITFFGLVYFCWLSSILETATESTRDYIYMNDWSDRLNQVDVKVMTVMSMRSLRPVRLTAMGMVELRLGTFIEAMRVAYSFFTFLRKV